MDEKLRHEQYGNARQNIRHSDEQQPHGRNIHVYGSEASEKSDVQFILEVCVAALPPVAEPDQQPQEERTNTRKNYNS